MNMEMSDEDSQALEAAKLYADNATFREISEKIGVTPSSAQILVRRGIELSLNVLESSNPGEPHQENPGVHQRGGDPPLPVEMPSLNLPQDPRTGSYILETTGIGRRVMLTPKCLMIYDLWKGAGFEGDLSDFLEDSVNFLYESKRPAERFG